MELYWKDSQRILRKGRAALLLRTRLPIVEDGAPQVVSCYEQAANALEKYAVNTVLPHLEQELAEAPRKSRLHWVMPTLSLWCNGEIVDDRWLSITVTLSREEGEPSRKEHRVWDAKTGRLCPLEWFVPRQTARNYYRWSFFLKGETVWGISTRKGGNNPIRNHEEIGKMKKLPYHY